jgi:hypothetical protein
LALNSNFDKQLLIFNFCHFPFLVLIFKIFFDVVTVDAANAGGWQVPTEDGGFVQIEAPNLIIQQPEEEMVEMEVGEDLHVAEEYDPMAFFAGPADLNQDHQEPDPNVGQAVDSSIIGKFTTLNDLKKEIELVKLN